MALLVGQSEICATCFRELKPGEPCVPTVLYSQTRGLTPRLKSQGRSVYLCIPCAVSRASGQAPEGAFNHAVYLNLRDILTADPAVLEIAFNQLKRERILAEHCGPTLALRSAG